MREAGGFGKRWTRIAILAAAAAVLSAVPRQAWSAGPEIFLLDEPENYLVIDKLEGMGLLPGLMTSDRGLEVREVSREAEASSETDDPFLEGMGRYLRLGGEPKADFRVRLSLEHSGDGRIPPNSQGLPVAKDGGVRAGGFFRWSALDWAGFQGRADYLASAEGDRIGRVEETSIRLGWPQATLEAGRFSLWWGPGRHGALIFTTNAQPLPGVRIRNPRPIRIGWWLRFLGLFQYDLFLARLEEGRPIPHALLSGVRLAIKPKPWLELGASRAMYFGGKDRGNGFSDWWDSFLGRNEDDPMGSGNQLAGFDLSLNVPLGRQPVKLYAEVAGEDQSGGTGLGFPSKRAYLGGIFFPSLFGSPRIDLRFELATNHLQGNGPSWYTHFASGEGYAHRYRGQILGHHMGTDARDIYGELHYFLLPASYLELSLDMTQRYSPGPEREKTQRVSGAFVGWFTKNLRGEGRISLEDVKNEGGILGNDSRDAVLQAGLAYQYR